MAEPAKPVSDEARAPIAPPEVPETEDRPVASVTELRPKGRSGRGGNSGDGENTLAPEHRYRRNTLIALGAGAAALALAIPVYLGINKSSGSKESVQTLGPTAQEGSTNELVGSITDQELQSWLSKWQVEAQASGGVNYDSQENELNNNIVNNQILADFAETQARIANGEAVNVDYLNAALVFAQNGKAFAVEDAVIYGLSRTTQADGSAFFRWNANAQAPEYTEYAIIYQKPGEPPQVIRISSSGVGWSTEPGVNLRALIADNGVLSINEGPYQTQTAVYESGNAAASVEQAVRESLQSNPNAQPVSLYDLLDNVSK